LQRFVEESRKIGAIGVQCFNQTENRGVEFLYELRQRFAIVVFVHGFVDVPRSA